MSLKLTFLKNSWHLDCSKKSKIRAMGGKPPEGAAVRGASEEEKDDEVRGELFQKYHFLWKVRAVVKMNPGINDLPIFIPDFPDLYSQEADASQEICL